MHECARSRMLAGCRSTTPTRSSLPLPPATASRRASPRGCAKGCSRRGDFAPGRFRRAARRERRADHARALRRATSSGWTRGRSAPRSRRRSASRGREALVRRSRHSSGATLAAARAGARERLVGQPRGRHAPRVPRSRRGLLRLQRRRHRRARDAGRGRARAHRDRRLRRAPGQRQRRDLRRRRRGVHLLDPRRRATSRS